MDMSAAAAAGEVWLAAGSERGWRGGAVRQRKEVAVQEMPHKQASGQAVGIPACNGPCNRPAGSPS